MNPAMFPYPIHLQEVFESFHDPYYLRINSRRLEHLASLNLPLSHKNVLEVGAGIGDLSWFYLDRGCQVTALEARPENCEAFRYLMNRHQDPLQHGERLRLIQSDMETISTKLQNSFEIVMCYGLLYHLGQPEQALADLEKLCQGMLLLETRVSFGDALAIHPIAENTAHPTYAYHGTGCRPTRRWIYEILKQHFEHVYVPVTQPAHFEFPLNWEKPPTHDRPDASYRAVFIASRQRLKNPLLSEALLMKQEFNGSSGRARR